MVTVYWLLQHASAVPASDDWLSASERADLARFWAPKRVRDWRLGRWTAKRALATVQVAGISRAEPAGWTAVSIRATEGGAPCALVGEAEGPWAISLSHSGEYGLCAIAERPAIVGCDVETVGRRGEEFVVDWFTEAERARVAGQSGAGERSQMVTLVWSAKESALKALGVGLRLDTREVEVEIRGPESEVRSPGSDAWRPLVVHAPNRVLHGWWTIDGDRAVTIVADPEPAVPVGL